MDSDTIRAVFRASFIRTNDNRVRLSRSIAVSPLERLEGNFSPFRACPPRRFAESYFWRIHRRARPRTIKSPWHHPPQPPLARPRFPRIGRSSHWIIHGAGARTIRALRTPRRHLCIYIRARAHRIRRAGGTYTPFFPAALPETHPRSCRRCSRWVVPRPRCG